MDAGPSSGSNRLIRQIFRLSGRLLRSGPGIPVNQGGIAHGSGKSFRRIFFQSSAG